MQFELEMISSRKDYTPLNLMAGSNRENRKGKNMSINLKNKEEIVKKFGKDAKDTGSTEVQIALLSAKINELTEHLKINAKDFQGRRGLLMMVGKRKRLLAYLKNDDLSKYRTLIKKLNIRG